MRVLRGLILCVCAASALASPAQSRQASDAARPVTVFADGVQAYVKLQKDLDGSLSALKSTTESEQIAGHQQALAGKIAAARRDARQGDIFTPTVTEHFHTIIRNAFQGPGASAMRRTLQEGDPVTLTILRVNDVYPEEIPMTTMPPTLLRLLPVLPTELAYRIIGRALVLQDIKTNVIVDFLPDAIPRVR